MERCVKQTENKKRKDEHRGFHQQHLISPELVLGVSFHKRVSEPVNLGIDQNNSISIFIA